MKALDTLRAISGRLSPCGIDSPERDAELLLRKALDADTVTIYRDNPELNDDQKALVEQMVKRRCRREPIQYILGTVDFLGMSISLGKGVLIPRPETELFASCAVELMRGRNAEPGGYRILDVCTGSGCLALALAVTFPDALVYATDISHDAVDLAKHNAQVNNTQNVIVLKGNLFDPLPDDIRFDLIMANPPYIKTADIDKLQPEIKNWEPVNALDGGTDGLLYYRKIISSSRRFMKDAGSLMLEIGDGQARDIKEILSQSGYSIISFIRDVAGKKRIVQAHWTR